MRKAAWPDQIRKSQRFVSFFLLIVMFVLSAEYSYMVLEGQKEKVIAQYKKMNLIEHHVLNYHR